MLSASRRLESPRWVASALSPNLKALQEKRKEEDAAASAQERRARERKREATTGAAALMGERQPLTMGAGDSSNNNNNNNNNKNNNKAAELAAATITTMEQDGGGSGSGSGESGLSSSGGRDTISMGELLRSGNFWRVVAFMTFVLFVSQQWRFMDLLMPKYTTRCFGENAPFASLASINFWGCVFFPPLVSSLTSGRDDMEVMLPGIWIMALAPLPLLVWQSLGGVALWVTLITLGEVVWSPRSSSYAASMAPTGREGLFLMLASWPTYLTKYPAGLFSGWLLDKYVPDCSTCKDGYGHFCDADPSLSPSSSTSMECVSTITGAEGDAAICPDGLFFASSSSSSSCSSSSYTNIPSKHILLICYPGADLFWI